MASTYNNSRQATNTTAPGFAHAAGLMHESENQMNDKFQALAELGAGDFEHLDGSLIEHLNGTKKLLQHWGASSVLQDAGLYHAVYGTAGFDQHLVSTDQRSKIASIIGDAAEAIAYQYCACDRKSFFPMFSTHQTPLFSNRFTGEYYYLPADTLRDFCELTAANETEIAIDNDEFIKQYGQGLCGLFTNMAPYLSTFARRKTAKVFGVTV